MNERRCGEIEARRCIEEGEVGTLELLRRRCITISYLDRRSLLVFAVETARRRVGILGFGCQGAAGIKSAVHCIRRLS
jgi:hypothetical protein